MEEILTSLSTYGYFALFLYSFGGGMLGIIAAGVLCYAGKMDLGVAISIAACANMLGGAVLFSMGRYNKKVLMPYIHAHKRKLALSHILMKRYGDKIIFIQKFIYGLKTLVPIAIGMTKYPLVKFHIINVVSAVLWAVILGLLSYKMGEALQQVASYFYANPYLAPLLLATIVGVLWLYFHKATSKKS